MPLFGKKQQEANPVWATRAMLVRILLDWQKKKISADELANRYYSIITSMVPFSLLTEKTVGEGNCADLVMPDERTWTAPMIDFHFTTASKVLQQIFDEHHTEIWEDFRCSM